MTTPTLTTRLLLASLRTYFRGLARLAPVTAGRHAYTLFSTPRKRGRIPPAVEPVMARAERLDLEVEGERVAAYRWPGTASKAAVSDAGSPVPRVMLAHGWESRAARLAVWVEPLLEAGYEVVAFDAPAHGDSAGRRSSPLHFVLSMQALVERVGPLEAVVAHSLGGLSTILAATGCGSLELPKIGLDRLVVLAGANSGVDAMSMFCEILGLGEAFLPLLLTGAAEAAGAPIASFDGHRTFVDAAIPTLWLHAPEDAQVPFAAAEKVATACPHVTLEAQPGLGHNAIARDPAMIARGLAFLTA